MAKVPRLHLGSRSCCISGQAKRVGAGSDTRAEADVDGDRHTEASAAPPAATSARGATAVRTAQALSACPYPSPIPLLHRCTVTELAIRIVAVASLATRQPGSLSPPSQPATAATPAPQPARVGRRVTINTQRREARGERGERREARGSQISQGRDFQSGSSHNRHSILSLGLRTRIPLANS